jgi:type IV pilus assembly protein PilX
MSINMKANLKTKNKFGFALPIVLFTLISISAIAALAVKVSLLDENLARTQMEKNISRQMAEIAVLDATDDIMCLFTFNGAPRSDINRIFDNKHSFSELMGISNDTCINGLCGDDSNASANTLWQGLEGATPVNGIQPAIYGQFTARPALSGINTRLAPRYIIESIRTNFMTGNPSGTPEYYYRITGVGFGRNNTRTFTKIQTIIRTKLVNCHYNPAATRNNN